MFKAQQKNTGVNHATKYNNAGLSRPLLLIAGVVIIGVIAVTAWVIISATKDEVVVTNYAECAAQKDARIQESYPEVCVYKEQRFTNPEQTLEGVLSSNVTVSDGSPYTASLLGINFSPVAGWSIEESEYQNGYKYLGLVSPGYQEQVSESGYITVLKGAKIIISKDPNNGASLSDFFDSWYYGDEQTGAIELVDITVNGYAAKQHTQTDKEGAAVTVRKQTVYIDNKDMLNTINIYYAEGNNNNEFNAAYNKVVESTTSI
jgi:hypothetical protein